jgi:hypothetical protein
VLARCLHVANNNLTWRDVNYDHLWALDRLNDPVLSFDAELSKSSICYRRRWSKMAVQIENVHVLYIKGLDFEPDI